MATKATAAKPAKKTAATSADESARGAEGSDYYASDGWPVFVEEDGERLSRRQWLAKHEGQEVDVKAELEAIAAHGPDIGTGVVPEGTEVASVDAKAGK